MFSSIKSSLLAFLTFGTVLINSSKADLSGRKVHPTGNNPQHYTISCLTNLVPNVSNIPEKMSTGNLEDSFRISYDFRQSGINFSDTNKYSINFFDNSGDRYGSGKFSTNGTGYLDFYVNGQALNNSSKNLSPASSMHIAICDSNNVYGLEKELGYNAQAGVNKSFSYTNSNLGKVIGSTKPLEINAPKDNFISWQGFEGVSYDILSTTNILEQPSPLSSTNCVTNGLCSFPVSFNEKIRFFKVQANIAN